MYTESALWTNTCLLVSCIYATRRDNI